MSAARQADPTPEVRARSSADLPALATIAGRTHRQRGYPAEMPEDVEAWLAGARLRQSFVALLDGEVVGQVSLATAAGDAAEATWCEALGVAGGELAVLKRLLVDPLAEGRGAGRTLLSTAEAAAHAEGLWPVLDVHDRPSRAVALYEQAGWRLVGRLVVPPHPGADCATLPVRCYAGPPPPGRAGR